ncbi:MAG: PEP/pyruvate-binding domain-containing protein [bacterium]
MDFVFPLGELWHLAGHPTLDAYAVVTAIVPILGTLVVTVVSAALFVVMLGFGITVTGRFLYSSVLFVVVFGLVAGGLRLNAALRRRMRPPLVTPLASVGSIGWSARDVGHKAANLAGFAAAGARVPMGWVVTADAFERFLRHNRLTPTSDEDPSFADRIRGGTVPRRLLRRLERTLVSSAARHFLLRSSFADEDRGDRAFPGVYESVPWDASAGRAALGTALKEVWASYWSERAVEYRTAAGPGAPPLRRLAVLANVRVAHDDLGFGSSADVRSGFTERHLVERATEGREHTSMHALLPNVVTELAGAPGSALDGGLVRQISQLAGRAELLLGRPVEIEWGSADGRVLIYQIRPLTSLPRRKTYTNSYVADTPRYALTPLSWWFVFGDEPPARLVSAGLERLGLGGLADDDVRVHHGVLYLRWERFKPLFVGHQLSDMPTSTALKVLVVLARAGARRRQSLAPPPIPSAPPAQLDAAALLARIERLREERLLPLTRAQALAVQAAAIVDGLLRQILGAGAVPAPRVATPLTELARAEPASSDAAERIRTVWFIADREAEISAMRAIDFPEAFLMRVGLEGDGASAGLSTPAHQATPRAPLKRPVRFLVRLRDRLLTEREWINAHINALDYEARLIAERLSARVAESVDTWEPSDVYYLTPPEIRSLLAQRVDLAGIRHTIRQRRAVHARESSFDHPAVIHVDERGTVVTEPPLAFGPDVLTIGIPLGGGTVRAPVRVLRSGALVSPQSVVGQIVVLPDPAAIWTGVASRAAGLLFARGGPLSHLAIWCRERGIPTIVAPRRIYELVRDGDMLSIDADRGEVRRA